jgi:hypothetical protein
VFTGNFGRSRGKAAKRIAAKRGRDPTQNCRKIAPIAARSAKSFTGRSIYLEPCRSLGIFGRCPNIRTLSGLAWATCAHTNARSEPMTYAGDNPAEP